ncbi:Ger(x)C family spore germination protein [Lysinibacillus fusiformis]|uniref:Ger(x)C family spore germination protein n=1 Tax=Lysinibacillus fusiformis TaxID=28031 RepID=UPI003BA0963F
MRKIDVIILILILLTPLYSGCWDSKEVNELSIAVALGIDKNDDMGFTVSVQVLNAAEVAPSSIGGGGGYDTPVTTYTATGDILYEALRKLTKQLPHRVYLAHLRMIIIGEEVAKEGVYNTIDFLSRDPSMRNDVYMAVSKNCTAKDVLEVLTSTEKIPANKLLDTLETSSNSWASISKVTITDFIDDIEGEGTQPFLPAVRILGELEKGSETNNVQNIKPFTSLAFDGIAAFRKDKMIDWLEEEESIGLNYVKGKVKNTIIVTKINKGHVGIELINSTSVVTPLFSGSEFPTIQITISGEANVAEVNSNLDLMSGNIFSELEAKTNECIEDTVTEIINKSQDTYRTDIFGFGHKIYKKSPKKWKEIKKDWTEIYPEIKIEVSSNIKIKGMGSINNLSHHQLIKE